MRRRPVRSSTPARGQRPSRFRTVLGIPIPLIVAAMALSALLGVQLAVTLEASTSSRVRTVSSTDEGGAGAGKNESGLPVVTESTLGPEVQRLVDTGTIQPMTSFDATQCLREQGIDDSVLIMEEVAWGPEETPSWLLVHGPVDRETLRAAGGAISASVVLPSCGSGDDQDTDAARLWSGHIMIGSV